MMYPQCLRVRQMVLQAYADVGGPQVRYNDTYTQCVYSTAVDQTTKTNAELCQVAVLSVQKRLCDAVRYTIAHYAASYAPVDAIYRDLKTRPVGRMWHTMICGRQRLT